MARLLALLVLLFFTAGIRAELEVVIQPRNDAAKQNIEAYIGPISADSRQAMWRMARASREQALSALQALGYYHARVRPRVTGTDAKPVLRLDVSLQEPVRDRKSTRLNSSHVRISYAVFCLKKKKKKQPKNKNKCKR